MATATGVSGGSPQTVSDDERRWVVVGICLTKVLTPALRDVLANEMPIWHKTLVSPPDEIDKQTFKRHMKNPPHSTFKLNYESINNNFSTYKSSYRNYDFAVKDPVSLAKLFMKHFMASFTGFDQTMDTSAALSVVAEAQPFHAASGIAKKIRSDVRNEWAHCNFSHWTDVNYQAALKDVETLINNINLTPAEKKETLDDLDGWKQKGLNLCFGQPVDAELLNLVNTEVAELRETVKKLGKEVLETNQSQLLYSLETIGKSFKEELEDLKERQLRNEKDIEQLKQLTLNEKVLDNTSKQEAGVPTVDGYIQGQGRNDETELDGDDHQINTARDERPFPDTTKLSSSELTRLSLKIVTKWKDIAGLANLDGNEFENVNRDYINYTEPKDKARRILTLIMEKSNFSRRKLGYIFKEVGLEALVDGLLKGTFNNTKDK